MNVFLQIPPECVSLPPMATLPTIDARLMSDGIQRSEHEKTRQNFPQNQYVELII